jgi:hypothetical protein
VFRALKSQSLNGISRLLLMDSWLAYSSTLKMEAKSRVFSQLHNVTTPQTALFPRNLCLQNLYRITAETTQLTGKTILRVIKFGPQMHSLQTYILHSWTVFFRIQVTINPDPMFRIGQNQIIIFKVGFEVLTAVVMKS